MDDALWAGDPCSSASRARSIASCRLRAGDWGVGDEPSEVSSPRSRYFATSQLFRSLGSRKRAGRRGSMASVECRRREELGLRPVRKASSSSERHLGDELSWSESSSSRTEERETRVLGFAPWLSLRAPSGQAPLCFVWLWSSGGHKSGMWLHEFCRARALRRDSPRCRAA